jgi:hypothetical protein
MTTSTRALTSLRAITVERVFRAALILTGVLIASRGAYLLLHAHLMFLQYRSIVLWLAAGSVLHDLLIAPASLLLGKLLHKPLLRSPIVGNAVRAAWLGFGAAIVIGLPLIGGAGKLPILGGRGQRANPTVIPGRPVLNLAISIALLIAGAAVVAGLSLFVRSRRRPVGPQTAP